jgi:hypothetical protein
VEFGVEIGEYHGVVRVPRRVFQRLLPERPAPERCVEAYYLHRSRLESIAERKVRGPPVKFGSQYELVLRRKASPTFRPHALWRFCF